MKSSHNQQQYNSTPVPPQTVTQNPCGIDQPHQPHQLHTATPQQAQQHIRRVLCQHPWLRSKAASILEQSALEHLPDLSQPRLHSETWYSVQLMRAYLHSHSTQAVRQRIEQLYEVML